MTVYRTGGLGDTLLCVPMLRALRGVFATTHIEFIGSGSGASILRAAGLVDSVHDLSVDFVRKPAALVDDHPRDPHILLAFTSSQEVIGRLTRWPWGAIRWDPHPPVGVHAAEHLLRALTLLGIWPKWQGPQAVDPLTFAEEPARVASCPRAVTLHPGAGAPWKRPPMRLFHEVFEGLVHSGRQVQVIQGPAESRRELVAAFGRDSVISPQEAMSLASVLRQSAAYAGCDSGVSHLAGILGVYTVAVFGPTHPRTWSPLGPRVHVLRSCSLPPADEIRACHRGDCFDGISADGIIGALTARHEAVS
ncbi:MAG TPA: glycosyltransferase family 9 protein [Chloroflexota bacterium]|nr:glycosyltransferase family 9 protein [Chloroflexota bacterium]